ncbi:MAG: MFS transporter, partial [Acetatifactor sp.]|nr:MFS transporter [Acetatifactor sp.]
TLFGMTSSAAVVGTLAAGLFIFQNKWIDLRKNLKNLFLLNSALMVLIGVGSLFMTAVPMVYFALFLFLEFLLGVVTSCVNVPLMSSLQTRVPIDYQGRFFALLSFSSSLLIPLGITYTGFLASVMGPDLAYIINNLCVIVIVLLCGACI